jgi:hypothetical protein
VHGLVDGLDDPRMRVAKNQWAPGTDVINVTMAVEIEEILPFPTLHERRLTADGAKCSGWTVDAAGDDTPSAFECGEAARSGNR